MTDDQPDEGGGTFPPYQPGSGDTVLARIDAPPAEVLARLHGGPCDGHVVVMRDYPGEYDTVRIEDDVDPSQPDARYVPRDVQPADRRFRDLDYVEPDGPIEEIGD